MKRIILLTLLLTAAWGSGQSINVSTTSHTVPQLVNNVLINSPCVEATNVTWSTGTNFGSSNGLGYFSNSNPNFPMSSGVVLSTGNALNAAGPNTAMLNDGSPAWPGDAQLQATLAAAGISMSSVNATVLEFDFTPISTHFNFDFVFASEEYGNFQCQFSDAFAFLLTNMNTGVTTNLAVVPGTNLPISVVTIRDFLYNSSCPSANAQYFGSFNGGSAAATSATNFNGQTKLMNASAVLVPNTPYHIKLVIADRTDSQSDSAIFINSDSFNIGQDVLGLDLTVDSGRALCYGTTYTLDTGLNASDYTFSWTKNGTPLTGETGPSIQVTQPGNYGVTYTSVINTCLPVTDDIKVEYYPQITTGNPIDISRCQSGAASYSYNLALNTPIITANMPATTAVTYHATQDNADNDVGPLPANYTSAPGQTIYARVENTLTHCYTVKTFQLLTSPPPAGGPVPDQILCARSLTQHNAYVNLIHMRPLVLNGAPAAQNTVTFYNSQANATSASSPITVNLYLCNNNTVVYWRIQSSTDPTCFSTGSFTVIVNDRPPVDNPADVVVCQDYILPALTNGNYFTGPNGTGTMLHAGDAISETATVYVWNQPGGPDSCGSGNDFEVKIIDPNQLSPSAGTYCGSFTIPEMENGEYRTQANGGGTVIAPGTVITQSQTLHFYFMTQEEPFCVIDTDVDVTILPQPQLPAVSNVFDCASYTLPALSAGHYYTQPNAQGQQLAAGTVISSTQTIYVYAPGGTSDHPCYSEKSFVVTIGMNNPPDISQCDPYTLPVLASGNYYTGPGGTGELIPGGTILTGEHTLHIYIPGSSACVGDLVFNVSVSQPPVDQLDDVSVCESFTLPALTHGAYYTGSHRTGVQLFPGDLILETGTVYIYAESAEDCFHETSFTVTIIPLPPIDSRSDIDVCNAYTLTALDAGNYYTGPGGTGQMLAAGTVINTSQHIYIYAAATDAGGCSAENGFDINIFSIEADSPADVVTCDAYTLPPLTIGNYYANSGGPAANEGMLHAGDVISQSGTFYVYTESGERINCTDENAFHITINHTPVLPDVPTQNACVSYTLPELTAGNYYTGPGGTGMQLHEDDVITSTQTIYIYGETGTVPNCSAEKSFAVNIFKADQLADVTICEGYTLPALTNGKYYTGPNATGTMLAAGTVIHMSQTIYVHAIAPFVPHCTDETSFNVTIVDAPVAHAVPATMTTACDEDGTNDGIYAFDLTPLNATVLGSQSGPEFVVSYHESLEDATTNANAVTASEHTLVWVRVSNTLAPACFDVRQISLHINKLPEPQPISGVMCYDTHTNTLINPYVIHSGLPSGGYSFLWHDENGNAVGTGNSYTAIAPGTYTVTATSLVTGCSSAPMPATVIPSEPAVLTYSVTEDFADSQSVTIIADGTGNYEFQLDNGPWQDSNVFDNVSSGLHLVTVRDKNGCGQSTTHALVVNYPKYFTPNGDGVHDTWNITDLNDQASSLISIYDRYGKLLTQIRPDSNGWDGTFNGSPLPSTDYWFVVNYEEDGQEKEFRAHFAMKR